MFMSGHPLDHFKFELKYYGIAKLIDFNEVKESNTLAAANKEKNMRIAGLVTDAQHRISRNGKNFGSNLNKTAKEQLLPLQLGTICDHRVEQRTPKLATHAAG